MDEPESRPATPAPADPGSPPALAADVLLDGRVGADDEELLLAALTACGVAAQVKVIPPRRDAQAFAWLVLIALPLQGFVSTIGTKMAEDAYAMFTQAVRRLLHHHRRSTAAAAAGDPPVLVLQDPVTGLRIILEPDLPGAAHEQLRALDLSRYRYGPLHYDRARHSWRSELDEADTAQTSS